MSCMNSECAEDLGFKNLLAKAVSQLLKLVTVLPASICSCELGFSIINISFWIRRFVSLVLDLWGDGNFELANEIFT